MDELSPTARTRLRRLPDRGSYDRRTIYQILDEGLVCHVGFILEGQPFVIPTAYARHGDTLYVHGSAASRTLRALREGTRVCVTVTHVDGLVLARSAFHHSMNYRSVVLFGLTAELVDPVAKLEALRQVSEHMVRGRWADARRPTDLELRATSVFALPIDEASAKVRAGPPSDDAGDYGLEVWAGVIPLRLEPGAPEPDPRLSGDVPPPSYVTGYSRNGGRKTHPAA